MRAGFAAALLSLALACVVGAPVASAELSGGNALNELTKSEPETTPTTTTATTATTANEESSNSSPVAYLAIGAGAVLLIGIVFVIMRDVRKVAPAGDVELAEATAAQDAALRVRKRRAKAKAARQQRKRNRR